MTQGDSAEIVLQNRLRTNPQNNLLGTKSVESQDFETIWNAVCGSDFLLQNEPQQAQSPRMDAGFDAPQPSQFPQMDAGFVELLDRVAARSLCQLPELLATTTTKKPRSTAKRVKKRGKKRGKRKRPNIGQQTTAQAGQKGDRCSRKRLKKTTQKKQRLATPPSSSSATAGAAQNSSGEAKKQVGHEAPYSLLSGATMEPTFDVGPPFRVTGFQPVRHVSSETPKPPELSKTGVRKIQVLNPQQHGTSAYVLRGLVTESKATDAFVELTRMPSDNRPHPVLKNHIVGMGKGQFSEYVEKLGGFTPNYYPHLKCISPRLAVTMAKPEYAHLHYQYSHQPKRTPLMLPPTVDAICDLVAQTTKREYNSVLANEYRNEEDCIFHHKDNEPGLDLSQGVVSISLGATRTFEFKRRPPHVALSKRKSSSKSKSATTPSGQKKKAPRTKWTYVRFPLKHGDVLVMCDQKGGWTHSVPRVKRGVVFEPLDVKHKGNRISTKVRFSVTLRKVKGAPDFGKKSK